MTSMTSMRPRLARWARLHWDSVRRRHVVLAPENVLFVTSTAAEVLSLCDGHRTVEAVVAELSEKYPGAPVARDVFALLTRLAARGVVEGVEPTREEPSSDEAQTCVTDSVALPMVLLAELTHRCPLRCGYCSNPVDLGRYRDEMDTATWERVLREAAQIGALQLHLSGGEPLLRTDLEALVRAGRQAGLYTNLITSAYGLDDARLDRLAEAGLEHVQISFQDTTAERGDPVAGVAVHEQKIRAARMVKARGMALSVNMVIHRGNVDRVGDIIDLAESLGAERLELANAQYQGWALRNRDALLPSRAALERAAAIATEAAARLRGRMAVIYVLPDYYTDIPKPCMNGWGRRFVTVAPDGTVLPCPGAHELPLPFERVQHRSLAAIWFAGEVFWTFRGTAWMREPCASCDRRDIDYGGCRCQAFAITGDVRNTDPACARSPWHGCIVAARDAAEREPPPLLYRVRTGRDVGTAR